MPWTEDLMGYCLWDQRIGHDWTTQQQQQQEGWLEESSALDLTSSPAMDSQKDGITLIGRSGSRFLCPECSGSEISNQSQIWSWSVFVNKSVLGYHHACLFGFYLWCFPAAKAELGICERDNRTHGAENINNLALYRESLPPPALIHPYFWGFSYLCGQRTHGVGRGLRLRERKWSIQDHRVSVCLRTAISFPESPQWFH